MLGQLASLRPSFGKVSSRKVDRLSTARFGSARYSVPTKLVSRGVELHVVGDEVRVSHYGEVVATHNLAGPGEVSVRDQHYGGPRRPARQAPRPRTAAEKTTAVSLLDRLIHYSIVVVTDGESIRMKDARQRGGRPQRKTA